MTARIACALALASLIGCGSDPVATQADAFQQRSADRQAKIDAKAAEINGDPSVLVSLTEARIREVASEWWGTENAKAATMTIDPKAIEKFGGERWLVKAQYAGKNENDTPFEHEFEVTWEFGRSGDLYASSTR